MTGDVNDASGDGRPAVEMRLRPSRAPVTRLSRKVLLGLGTVAAVGIGGALFFRASATASNRRVRTLQHQQPDDAGRAGQSAARLHRPAHNAPQLGPPLPGDLGRPMVNAGTAVPGMPQPAAGPSPEQQRIAQEQEAARTSHFVRDHTIPANRLRRHSGGGGTARRRAQRRRVAWPDLPGPQAGLPETAMSIGGRSARIASRRRPAPYPPGRRGYRRNRC